MTIFLAFVCGIAFARFMDWMVVRDRIASEQESGMVTIHKGDHIERIPGISSAELDSE